MAEYTPTTDDRLCGAITDFANDLLHPDHQREARWAQVEEALAAHDRAVKAEALREAADAPERSPAGFESNTAIRNWLRARADQIEGATE